MDSLLTENAFIGLSGQKKRRRLIHPRILPQAAETKVDIYLRLTTGKAPIQPALPPMVTLGRKLHRLNIVYPGTCKMSTWESIILFRAWKIKSTPLFFWYPLTREVRSTNFVERPNSQACPFFGQTPPNGSSRAKISSYEIRPKPLKSSEASTRPKCGRLVLTGHRVELRSA